MGRLAAVVAFLILVATPAGAQRRDGRYGAQGIPPGHLPPPGECRVWYDDRPPGHQPPPTSCRAAERIASRDPYARVIYGDEWRRGRGTEEWRYRDRPRPIPRQGPSRYPFPSHYPDRWESVYSRVPFDNGYRDGYDKGRDDVRDHDSYDPVRHGRYRSADHGYRREYGPKEDYKYVYREGFEAGYDEGYREWGGSRDRRRDATRRRWPF